MKTWPLDDFSTPKCRANCETNKPVHFHTPIFSARTKASLADGRHMPVRLPIGCNRMVLPKMKTRHVSLHLRNAVNFTINQISWMNGCKHTIQTTRGNKRVAFCSDDNRLIKIVLRSQTYAAKHSDSQLLVEQVNTKYYFYTRTRGLFRNCYPKERPPSSAGQFGDPAHPPPSANMIRAQLPDRNRSLIF